MPLPAEKGSAARNIVSTQSIMSDDRMSSVSNTSKFSIKFQIHIAKQDDTIATMRRIMIAAGLDPDVAPALGPEVLVLADALESCPMDVSVSTNSKNSKKRLPSGSPDGKEDGNEDQSESEDSCGDGATDAAGGNEEEMSGANWRVYQLRRNKRSPEKKMSKKARSHSRIVLRGVRLPFEI